MATDSEDPNIDNGVRDSSLPANFSIWFDRGLLAITAIIMFGMMAVTFVDVVGRYVFDRPIHGGFEMIQFMMPLAMFTALPIVTRDSGHITISLLDGTLAPRAAWIQRLIILIGSAGVVAFISWLLWLQGNELLVGQNISGFLEWPFYPPAYAISALSFVTFVLMIGVIVQHLKTSVEEFALSQSAARQPGPLD